MFRRGASRFGVSWVVMCALQACAADDADPAGEELRDASQDDAAGDADVWGEAVSWGEVSEVFSDRDCSGCHGATAQSYASVVDAWVEADGSGALADKMTVRHQVTDEQALLVLSWLAQGYPGP